MRLRTLAISALAAPCVVAAALLVAAWPATMALLAVVAVGLLLAWRIPALALAMGLLMLGFEGSIKALLGLDGTPLPGGSRAAGAAAIDLVLFAGVLAVLVRDRGRTPRSLWRRLGRAERVALGLLVAWLVVSVPQILQNENLRHGLAGFRLFQAYVLVGVAVAVLFTVPWFTRHATVVLLGLGIATGLYAAVRVVVGPASAERFLALDTSATAMYGPDLRAVGSFSGAVGMNSYLIPLALFGLVLGLLVPRLRLLGWAVTALSIAPIAASDARTPLVGVALALALMLVVLLSTSDLPRRRKVAFFVAALAGVAVTYGAIHLASRGTPVLRKRAGGILHPLRDESMRLRYDHWQRALDEIRERPLGSGVGAQGGSAGRTALGERTPDNSFLKVYVEQGVLVGTAFVLGLLGLVVAIVRRLRRVEGEPRAVGLAALTGFAGFLGLSLLGETVEQPGKAIAWSLLAIAFVVAVGGAPGATASESIPASPLRAARRDALRALARPAWIAAAAALVLIPVAITLARSPASSEASVVLSLDRSQPAPPSWGSRRWYASLYRDEAWQRGVLRAAGLPVSPGPFETIRLKPLPGGRMRLSARLGSAQDARRFVGGVAFLVLHGSQYFTVLWARQTRRVLVAALRGHPSPERRRRMRTTLRFVRGVMRAPPIRVKASTIRSVTRRRPGDRVLAVVPGFRSARPSALAVALAGLVVAIALRLAAVLAPAPTGASRAARDRTSSRTDPGSGTGSSC